MKLLSIILASIFLTACGTITNDAYVPIALSFSDGGKGNCKLRNKRQTIQVDIPSAPLIRRSDDDLTYDCETPDGRESYGSIPSSIQAAQMGASVIFFDLGITDAITDKSREYPKSYVIPMEPAKSE